MPLDDALCDEIFLRFVPILDHAGHVEEICGKEKEKEDEAKWNSLEAICLQACYLPLSANTCPTVLIKMNASSQRD